MNDKAEKNMYNVSSTSDSLWKPAINFLRNTVSALQKKGSIVVLVLPPEKSSSRKNGAAFNKITDSIFSVVAAEYHLKFLHFENDAFYTDDYFVDDIHLNEPGTRIYSMQLADSIKSIVR